MLAAGWCPWVAAVVGMGLAAFILAWVSFRREVRRQFIEYLKEKLPDIEVVRESTSRLELRSEQHGGGTMFFQNLYGQISALKPDSLEGRREVFGRLVSTLEEHLDSADAKLDLETHGDRILPRLATPGFLAGLPSGMEIPRTRLGDTGLLVTYVLDSEHSVMHLTQEHLSELELDLAALHARALENLQKRFPADVVRGALQDGQLQVFKAGDTFDAARILLIPQFLEEGQEIAAAIPDRDTLCIAKAPVDDDWSAFEKLAAKAGGEHRLLSKPVKVTRSGFRVV